MPASHPTQPIATRPLAIRKDGTWYAYGWDLTKNICEIFGQHGYPRTAYTYSPYGEVTADGDVTQPIQWSSEYNDTELALVYYNYRHYNPIAGRWLGRDCLLEFGCINLYKYAINNPHFRVDILGMKVDSHHTERCNGDDDCDKLKEGLDAWNKHYEKRYRELQEDQYNYKTTNIKKYNNHIERLDAARKNIQHCIKLMRRKKCNDCGGGDGVLVFEKYPIPDMLKEPEQESLSDNIDWGGIGEVIVIGAAAGLGVLALAAVATASAPVAAGAAAVIVVSSVIIGNASDNKEA